MTPTQRFALLLGDLDSVKAVQVYVLKKCNTPDWQIAVWLGVKPRVLQPTIDQVNQFMDAKAVMEWSEEAREKLL